MYVQRNSQGEIVGLFANFQEGFAEEFLKNDSKEVIEFYEKAMKGSVNAEHTI